MICWQDFVLDDTLGFYLKDVDLTPGRIDLDSDGRPGSRSIMDDARIIQETGQVLEPARMVGLSGLDSFTSSGMEADSGGRGHPSLILDSEVDT